jgi:hypothetical protein
VQPRDRVPHRGEHPLDLVLAALVDAQLDRRGSEQAGLRGGGQAVVELDAFPQALHRFL